MEADYSAIFAKDSTALLMKKFLVYKLMGSDLFINHSLWMMNLSYRLLGVRLTNFAITRSVGSLFTSGETIDTLLADIAELEEKNIHGVGMSVVEGLPQMDETKI